MRVRKTAGDSTTTYLWDRESGLPLLVDDGTNGYVHADGVHEEIATDGTTRTLLSDGLGSVRGSANGSGTLTGSAEYDVFGSERGTITTGSVFGFTGEQQDAETGLTYLRARYLDTDTGRFLSTDTVQPNAPGTQGYNLYAYVANNPTTWIDPSGHVADLTGPLATVLNSHAYAVALMSPTYGPAIAAATAAALSTARSHWGAIPIAVIGILVVSCWLTECVDYDLPRLRADEFIAQSRRGWKKFWTRYQPIAWPDVRFPPPDPRNPNDRERCEQARFRPGERPTTADSAIEKLLDELWRPGGTVGSGNTADAVRHQLQTGELVGGVNHIQKAHDFITALKSLRARQNLTDSDRGTIERILFDLMCSVRGL